MGKKECKKSNRHQMEMKIVPNIFKLCTIDCVLLTIIRYVLCIIVIVFCVLLTIDYVLLTGVAYANNVLVENVDITGQNQSAQTAKVQFDVSWDGSWCNAINYDAVWVFMKYSTDSGVTWNHATLKTSGTNPSGFSQGTGTGLTIEVPTDLKGAFLYRSADSSVGSVDTDSIQFVWNWGTDGLSAGDSARVKVFAIEMVYIPEGVYELGDGDGTNESTNAFHITDNTKVGLIGTDLVPNIKVDVNDYDDNQIEASGIGIDGNSGLDTDNNGSVDNADFPTGYTAFYLMKYEVSQGQYRDFLNTLTRTQQNARTETDVSTDTITNVYVMSDTTTVSSRQGIRCPASGNGTTDPITFGCDLDEDGTFDESDDGEWIGCGYLCWMDLCAYADWAALRPMTELEFEKAARGPNAAITGEYAWGTTNITAFSSLSNAGTVNEVSGTAGANCNYDSCSPDGAVRVGMFTTANSTREEAGAGYYGIMGLSGNLWDRAVTLGNSTGRSFTGSHGDGEVTTTASYEGNATNADWPGIDATPANGVTGATGSGYRGGSWWRADTFACLSGRDFDTLMLTVRYSHHGGRCARTP